VKNLDNTFERHNNAQLVKVPRTKNSDWHNQQSYSTRSSRVNSTNISRPVEKRNSMRNFALRMESWFLGRLNLLYILKKLELLKRAGSDSTAVSANRRYFTERSAFSRAH